MVNFVAVSKDRHTGKRWRRPEGYTFAATQTVVPVMWTEFPRVALCMPIAFIEQSGCYVAVGVMSVIEGRNLFVGPGGQWLGRYLPAALRSYPFGLARVPGAKEMTLCVDEESGLVVETDADAEPFFAANGTLSPALEAVVDFLRRFEHNRTETDLAVAALAEAGLIQPWPEIAGLYRVDEAGLKAIEDATFLKLRSASALPLAYMQLLSMNQVSIQLKQQVAQGQGRQ